MTDPTPATTAEGALAAALDELIKVARNGAGDSAPNLLAARRAAIRAAGATERERAIEDAARELLDAEAQPAYSWVLESQAARHEGRPNREIERMDRISDARAALRAALASAPVQTWTGDEIDVERLARAISKHHRRTYIDMVDQSAAKHIAELYARDAGAS
jgi:hypothetical protein